MEWPNIRVVNEGVDEVAADVLALKYAQAPYGVDKFVAQRLLQAGENPDLLKPPIGSHRLRPGRQAVLARRVLFIGVRPLREFRYGDIREFARRVLTIVGDEVPEAKSVALTLHGPGFGLDEIEAFESELAGLMDALGDGSAPVGLREILIVERDRQRCERLASALEDLVPSSRPVRSQGLSETARRRLSDVGDASEEKPHVFVAMPYKSELEDLYHFGIQGAVHAAGYLCERMDELTFTGDVLHKMKERIQNCSYLIAELTGANPNVFLELGYAWGCDVPTILLASEDEDLVFDVRGQRCLVYGSIRDLRQKLTDELHHLTRRMPSPSA